MCLTQEFVHLTNIYGLPTQWGVLCVPWAHRQSAQALVLKELAKLLKGKRKENVKKGPFTHTH